MGLMFMFFCVFISLNFLLFYFYGDEFMKVLIGVEFVMLSLIMFYLYSCIMSYYVCIYILILSVCEGVVGLVILISLVGGFGSDFISFKDVIY